MKRHGPYTAKLSNVRGKKKLLILHSLPGREGRGMDRCVDSKRGVLWVVRECDQADCRLIAAAIASRCDRPWSELTLRPVLQSISVGVNRSSMNSSNDWGAWLSPSSGSGYG